MSRLKLLLVAFLILPAAAFGQLCETGWPITDIGTPAPSQTDLPVGVTTWSAGNVYHIQGFIFVPDGATLVIEPGTIIKADPGQGSNATAMIVERGGKIVAQGTQNLPIIFTSIQDDVCDTADIPDVAASRGLWGGLILLGRSYVCAQGGEVPIEGVPDFGNKIVYGGGATPICDDSSGVLQYVSLRYPGSILSGNNEINGLTMAGVGSKTVIDHIEVYFGLDDDFEWFGGSVNCKYLAAIFGDDDSFDSDECYTGTLQFCFEYKDSRWGDRLTENDGRHGGALTDTTTSPGIANATVPSGWGCAYPSYRLNANWTCIGQGENFSGSDGNRMLIRENIRAYWYNNVFMEQPKAAVEIDVTGGSDANIDTPPSSTRNLPSGAASVTNPLLDLAGNFWFNANMKTVPPRPATITQFFAQGNLAAPLSTARVQNDLFPGGDTTLTGKNHLINPLLKSYNRINPPVRDLKLDPVPQAASPLVGKHTLVPAYAIASSSNYTPVPYTGAFDPTVPITSSWIAKWTAVDVYGYLACCRVPGDANHDNGVNVGDAVFLINHVFKSGPAPQCRQEGNVNGDASVNVGDAVFLINRVFKSGPAPTCGY